MGKCRFYYEGIVKEYKQFTENFNERLDDCLDKLSRVYSYRGSLPNRDSLPTSGMSLGDVYNIEDDGHNLAWDGESWDDLGGDFIIDEISNSQIDALLS